MQAEKSTPLLYIGNMCAAQPLYESYEHIKTGFNELRCLTFMSRAEICELALHYFYLTYE